MKIVQKLIYPVAQGDTVFHYLYFTSTAVYLVYYQTRKIDFFCQSNNVGKFDLYHINWQRESVFAQKITQFMYVVCKSMANRCFCFYS